MTPALPPLRRVTWTRATRIVGTRYPPVHLFERVSSDPLVRDALIETENAVNPRLRDLAGEIRLVVPEERVSGPGASYVMAAFTHLNPLGSRFSDGTYGVYYTARTRATAVAEAAHHFARFARDAADGPRYEDFLVLVSRIDDRFHDLERLSDLERTSLLDPDSYAASQAWARRLREAASHGVHYPSVRHEHGRCLAIFRPKSAGLPRGVDHIQFHWDGTRVARYFTYGTGEWTALP